MTKIQDADAIFLGDETVDRVYLDSTQVWPSGVAPPFDPNSIANLVLWYDASDPAMIVTTTTQAFVTTVSLWKNKKFPGMLDLAQASSGLRPATGGRKIGTLNALEFFHSAQPNMMMSSSAWSNAAIKTIFVVCQEDTVAVQEHITSYTGGAPCVFNWDGLWGLYSDGGIQSTIAVDLAPHVISSVFGGPDSQIWVDGISGGTGSIDGGWVTQIGIGDDPGGGAAWNGLLGEYLVYNRLLTTTERQQVENYLLAKWGI